MILSCSFEEVSALSHGARSVLHERPVAPSAVAAPSATRGAVESLLAGLDGGFSIRTLVEQRELEQGLRAIVERLREELDTCVLATHAANEEAVSAYFDFAHALSVLGRVMDLGEEMSALVELMTGGPANERSVREFVFPD
ncbi:MAG: hypothetical protein WEG36_09385 [Gemmatimonadota bacterium]|jgi:hypothetical protein